MTTNQKIVSRNKWLTGLTAMIALAACVDSANAQSSSGYQKGWERYVAATGTTTGLGNWYYQPPPPKKQIRIHDLITIRVDEKSSTLVEGSLERRKNSSYFAALTDWLKLDGLKAVRPAPQANGDPTIAGSQKQLLRSEATLETLESIKFEIQAEVADIMPNGNLVLEAHKTIKTHEESWDYSITGICRPEDVAADNTVMSAKLFGPKLDFRPNGQISDSIKRGWLLRVMDLLHAF